MKFEMHPSAEAALNEQANVVAESVGIYSPAPRNMGSSFKPDVQLAAELTNSDLRSPMVVSDLDQSGNVVSRFVQESAGLVGFVQDAYQRLNKLAQSIQKVDAFRDVVSVRFVEDAIFNWSMEKLKGKINKSACEYVVDVAGKEVCTREFWIPIYGLHIQSAFSVGPVIFKTITREMIEQWHQHIMAKGPRDPRVGWKLERDKKELLGFAAATCEVEAEPIRAEEIARDLSDKAISLIRLFTIANFEPSQFSFCVPLGSHQRYGHHYLSVRSGIIVSETRGVTLKGQYPWVIDDVLLNEMNSTVLPVLSELFGKKSKGEFEDLVFDGLQLYSQAPLVPTLAEKLLYMFAALESILLRDEKETPTDTIAERLAFLVGNDVDSRLAIRKSVKQAYNIRSRFVHHGKRADADLTHFFQTAWTGICKIAEMAPKFKTKTEFLDQIEQYKYRS
jgi:hypothetical protein